MSIRLHLDKFWISPFSFAAYVGLTEKGIPFETRELALHEKENRRPEYQDASLTGKIPCLEHDGFWLAESGAILEYLDDAFPTPWLLPRDVKARARARLLMSFLRMEMMPLRDERPTTTMFYQKAEKPLSKAAAENAQALFEIAEKLLPEGTNSLFGEWAIADAELAFMLGRLVISGDEIPGRLRKYYDVQWARPSVRGFVERTRPKFVPY